MASGTKITTSKRLDALLSKKAFMKRVKLIHFQAALFMLGRHKESKGNFKDVLTRGFGRLGGSNKLTRNYHPLSEKYLSGNKQKGAAAFGSSNFHILNGDLFKDAIVHPKIRVDNKGFSITVRKGESSDYQLIQQNGGLAGRNKTAKIWKREFYKVDKADTRIVLKFIQKNFIQLLKSNRVNLR
jgi:hypothetical protein